MTRSRWLLPAVVCLMLGVSAPAALGATKFRPRIGHALGLIPAVNSQGNFNTEPSELGVFNAVTYHGGPTMTGGVAVHVIFWAPSGFAFQGSPGAGIPTHEGMIEQYFKDVSAASTGTSGAASVCSPTNQTACNDFTVEPQYGNGTSPGHITSGANTINFNGTSQTFTGTQTLSPSDSVILDSSPYPTAGNGPGQCVSPQDTKACIMDSALQTEVDNIVQHTTGTPRGLHNLWYVFLPPDVDECISQGVCGTAAFGGYHSLSNVNGHGLTIYALTVDPIIAAGFIAPGGDPQGNPDAEVTVDIADHEINEAMTDPTGIGWIDPNAFEVGDKCEFGPQRGTPLGFANGAPYNQVINGHKYLSQEIWSQADGGCVQASTKTIADSGLPLPQVNLAQFSGTVSGNIGSASANIPVEVQLLRAGAVVADRQTATDGSGSWSVTLQHPVGDDRDVIEVIYNHGNPGTGVPAQPTQVILTGNGGNPFIEGGWMGWNTMDNGSALTNTTLTLAPCFQTGVLSSTLTAESPTDFCGTTSDAATEDVSGPIDPTRTQTWSSNDNRAFQPPDAQFPNASGALVNLTVPIGEPNSVSAVGSPLLPFFTPGGFPTCTADLGAQSVSCSGLVAMSGYTVNGRSATSDGAGNLSVSLPIHRGDVITLSNGARVLTRLHVAHLRVDIIGDSASVSSGTCEPAQYWGGTLPGPVLNGEAGELGFGGPAATGQICPASGNAANLPTANIAQADDQSGGQTVTEVADVANTSPIQGETLYGKFTALAEATDGVSPIAVKILHGGSVVFSASNVDTANGVPVAALPPGNYTAIWTVTNPNGDTRTVTTRFIEESSLQGPAGPQGPPGPAGPKPFVTCALVAHHQIACTVTFAKAKSGIVRLRVTRGGRIVALGHARVSHGRAKLRMRELRRRTRGTWRITVVFSQTVRKRATTNTVTVRVR